MATVIIYGDAVQQARNRLRSAQISAMFEVLRGKAFDDGSYTPSGLDALLANSIKSMMSDPPGDAQLLRAQRRMIDFYDGSVHDVFAIGDALRELGEYFEKSVAKSTIDTFRDDLRNKAAFDRQANRARVDIAGEVLRTEHPELGIFKWALCERSVVKYVERCLGPYIGADISGSTTDTLAALAYLYLEAKDRDSRAELRGSAKIEIADGDELVPIATMVLQYHHSLLECGVALALASKAMDDTAALPAVNLYDYRTLAPWAEQVENRKIKTILDNCNATLAHNLAGRGLVVVRDWFDIEHNAYVDCEIALLVEQPAANPVFDLGKSYAQFAESRRKQIFGTDFLYRKSEPSLLRHLEQYQGSLPPTDWTGNLEDLCRLNSRQLRTLDQPKAYSDLDEALAAIRNPGLLNAAAPRPSLANATAGPATSGADNLSAAVRQLTEMLAPLLRKPADVGS